MTLSALANTDAATKLPNFADGIGFPEAVMDAIGKLVNLDPENARTSNVRTDVDRWITWTLTGGYRRPSANKRAVEAKGVKTERINAIRITQDQLCAALEPYYHLLDMGVETHFELLERATRPLPKNAR